MPGLLFSINISQNDLRNALTFLDFSGFKIKSHSNVENRLFVAENSYKGYPTQSWQRGQKFVFFEGMVYPKPKDSFPDELFDFITPSGFSNTAINKWVNSHDGEFVIFLVDIALQQAFFVNDRFGRLPVYLLKDGRKLALSREISFIHRLRTFKNPDIIGQAQSFLFGFALGNRSLWEKIERVEPNVQIQIDLINGRIMQQSFFNIQGALSAKNTNNHIPDLINQFNHALQNRIEVLDKPAVSLSGGLDSRLIAASLSFQNQYIPLITYSDFEQSASKDLFSATKVIQHLGLEKQHQVIELQQTTLENINEIIRFKQGLNGADMAFILPFLSHFQQNGYSMITGDGGDKTLDDLRPLVPIISTHHLINYLIQKHSHLSLKEVSLIFNIRPDELYQSIADQLNSYNTDSFENKFIHFMIRERAINWLFEGEDRNRYFTWSTTPYYNNDFFDLAMQLPMKQKAYGKAFRTILNELPGHLEKIDNPNWNAAIIEQRRIERLFLRQKIRYLLPNIISAFRPKNNQRIDINQFTNLIGIKSNDFRFVHSEWFEQLESLKLTQSSWFRLLTVLITDL